MKDTSSLSGTTPTYHYYLKDHLGNNRVVLNQNGTTVEQVNHYYPFGGLFDQTSETLQAYKYNGKKLDRTYGIDLYDYSARFMDGAVGRFTTMDPLSEKYYSVSPYGYVMNNPMKFVDPTGKWIVGTDGKSVTYNSEKGWSENASADVQRIGNSLLKTETGKERLNYMFDHDEKISMTISPEVVERGNRLTLGMNLRSGAKENEDGTITVGEHKMTIYEGSIKKAIGEKGVTEYIGLDLEDAIGVVAGHESGHTEKENTKQSYDNSEGRTNHDLEKRPNEIEKKIREELGNR